jgi:two-component system response regulator EvgA
MANILIADDHAVVRMAVRMLLEKAGHNVLGEADSGVDVIALARKLSPDLIILDIDMPHLDGFDVLQRLCANGERYKVLIFSGLQAESYSIRCSRAGAAGFVCKEGNLSELLTAVQIILAGYTLFPTTDLSSIDASSRLAPEKDMLKLISPRELSVLRYLARGYLNKDIAQEMLLSVKTISTYKARLIAKLQVANLVELADFAKRNELI